MKRKLLTPLAILALLFAAACGDDDGNDGAGGSGIDDIGGGNNNGGKKGGGSESGGACLLDDGKPLADCPFLMDSYAGAKIACDADPETKWVTSCPEGAIAYCESTLQFGRVRTYYYEHALIDIDLLQQVCEDFESNTWHPL